MCVCVGIRSRYGEVWGDKSKVWGDNHCACENGVWRMRVWLCEGRVTMHGIYQVERTQTRSS